MPEQAGTIAPELAAGVLPSFPWPAKARMVSAPL